MYIVKKSERITDINSPAWETANVAEVSTVNWGEFPHNPKMTARLLYSDFGLHVKLVSFEKDIIATKRNQNDMVCEDNCMEFFFSPNSEDNHYMNFEFNAFGTMYLGLRTGRYDPVFPTEDKEYFGVASAVCSEKWELMFTVPFEFMERAVGGHTKKFKGNIYNCGGNTAHYLSLYPIDTPKPNFHCPPFFGDFELE